MSKVQKSKLRRRRFLAGCGLATLAGALEGKTCSLQPALAGDSSKSPPQKRTEASLGLDLGNLLPDVQEIAGNVQPSLSYLRARHRSFDDFRQVAREKVLDLLGYRPERIDPRPEITERIDRGDHFLEKLRFSTSPKLRVPAIVLIPKNLRRPAPAVVDLHSHGGMFMFGKEKVVDFGRNHPAMTEYQRRNYDGRPTATALVRRGYVVISIDALFFGERRIRLGGDVSQDMDRERLTAQQVQQLNQQCARKEATLAKGLCLRGVTWTGIVYWDDVRTIDYLVTRKEVDPTRIGCLGISMGGYRAMYLTALDDRVKAGCVAGFMSTVQPMLASHLDIHSFVHFVPGLHRYLDWPDLASLACPRALMVLQCSQDRLFPLAGMQSAVKQIEADYGRAGRPEQFAGRFHDVPHQFSLAMQDDAFAWLDRHLAAG